MSETRPSILYLLKKAQESEPLSEWVHGGLSGPECNDACGEIRHWASGISLHLARCDHDLARLFNDDGGEHFSSTRPEQALDRRIGQLNVVLRELTDAVIA